MALQRIAVAKIGGISADIILQRLREWSDARRTDTLDEWSSDQWPADVRLQADNFAKGLREHACELPIVHYVEWIDTWSMGDVFRRWLTPSDRLLPIEVHTGCYEVFGYALPDDGRLSEFLASHHSPDPAESQWFVRRLRDAIDARQELAASAVIIVLRQVISGSVLDSDVAASYEWAPDWISERKPRRIN